MPLDPSKAHLFDPEDVPTVQRLLAQLPPQQLAEAKKVRSGLCACVCVCVCVCGRACMRMCVRRGQEWVGVPDSSNLDVVGHVSRQHLPEAVRGWACLRRLWACLRYYLL